MNDMTALELTIETSLQEQDGGFWVRQALLAQLDAEDDTGALDDDDLVGLMPHHDAD